MRVLVVNRYWKPAGGAEICARELADLLAERGHEAIPFAMADPGNWPTPYSTYFPSAVDFHSSRLSTRFRALRRATTASDSRRALRRLLDDEPVDVAHVFNAYHYLGSNVLLELVRRRIPVVLSLHDYKIACPNAILFSERTLRTCTFCLDHRGGFAWAPPVLRCRSSSVGAGLALSAEAISTHRHSLWRRVAGAVTVLNATQRRAAEHAGIDPSRIHLVPNPVVLREPPDRGQGERVLFVGRLTPLKGVDVLLRACERAGLPVRIIGDGPERSALGTLAAGLRVDAVFLGELPPTEVASEMDTAGVLAVPSLSPDVAPLVVTEAWSAGLPVVGSAIGGIDDFLADGRGVRCPPGDEAALATALRSVIDDPARGNETAARGRAYASAELGRDRWVERLRAVYSALGAQL